MQFYLEVWTQGATKLNAFASINIEWILHLRTALLPSPNLLLQSMALSGESCPGQTPSQVPQGLMVSLRRSFLWWRKPALWVSVTVRTLDGIRALSSFLFLFIIWINSVPSSLCLIWEDRASSGWVTGSSQLHFYNFIRTAGWISFIKHGISFVDVHQSLLQFPE